MHDGTAIFVELYLSQLPQSSGLEFRQRPHLLDSLRHRDQDAEVEALIQMIVGQ